MRTREGGISQNLVRPYTHTRLVVSKLDTWNDVVVREEVYQQETIAAVLDDGTKSGPGLVV